MRLRSTGYMMLIMIGFIVLLFISSVLSLPGVLVFAIYFMFVFALLLAGTMIPFFMASGKHFLSLTITVTETEKQYAYGMVKGDLRPIPLKKKEFEKIVGETIKGDVYAYLLELMEVPFIEDTGSYECILFSPEPLKIEELTLVDRIYPDVGFTKIQVHYGSMRAVRIGEATIPVQKTGLRARIKTFFTHRPEMSYKKIPMLVVYATHKQDVRMLEKVREGVSAEEIGRELITVSGRAFYDHARAINIIDEEKEKLIHELAICNEKVSKLLSAKMEQFDIKIMKPTFIEKSRIRELLEGKYTWIALGILIGAFVVMVLLKLLGAG